MISAEEATRTYFNVENNQTIVTDPSKLKYLLIEFAKHHVTQALKSSAAQMQLSIEDYEFILDSYPLNKIQ